MMLWAECNLLDLQIERPRICPTHFSPAQGKTGHEAEAANYHALPSNTTAQRLFLAHSNPEPVLSF
jgi:hypothetical protein